ncbi:MAG: hypothetical protein K6U75_01860 [Firmicutes bacterium]|nr:hypothetical protein [Bacillota bacterium]
MNSRERIRIALKRGIPDRVPMLDITFWPETLLRWQKEGLPEGADPVDYFGLDRIERFGFDGSLQLPVEMMEETDRWRIYRNANGLVVKEWKDSYAPPARLECTVRNWDEWLKVKARLQASPDRIPDWMLQNYRTWRERDWFVVAEPVEPMWYILDHLMGFQNALPLIAEQPDLIADILNTYTDFLLGMCELCVQRGITFDGLWFFSDLCYKNGMLFSPRAYRELLMPCHLKVKAWCEAQGIPMLLHCDGDVRQFIPLLIEAGFDAIQPLEARAGNDVRELKRLYGTQIVFFGNISADVMAYGTDEELEEEIRSKLAVAMEGGGYMYHSDHSIPPTVSLARYAQVVQLVRKYGQYG